MRDRLYRSCFNFHKLKEWYETAAQDSLDSVGVPLEISFLKIIKLDHEHATESVVPKRGVYTRMDFWKEVAHATKGHELGLGPQVILSGVVQEGDEAYAYIEFQKLNRSLDDILRKREALVTYEIVTPTKNWGDMSSDDEELPKIECLNTPPRTSRNSACSPSIQTPTLNENLESFKTWFEGAIEIMKTNKFYHLDMHEGNIFFDGGRWYLIDFGRVADNPKFETSLKQLIPRDGRDFKFNNEVDIILFSIKGLRKSIRNMSENDPNVEWNDLLCFLSDLVKPSAYGV